MGRYRTSACATDEVLRITISSLFKDGYLRAGCTTSGVYEWNRNGTPAGQITIEANLDKVCIRLIYTITDRDGIKTDRDYLVFLVTQPSNLGKGVVYYFICPMSGRRCRIIYSAYGSPFFTAREAYQNRLYYHCQMSSRLDKANDDYWRLERGLEKRPKQRRAYMYAGRPTKRYLKDQKTYQRLEKLDEERWSITSMPKKLWPIFQAECRR